MSLTTQLVLGFLLAVSIAYLATRVHSLSRDGAIAAVGPRGEIEQEPRSLTGVALALAVRFHEWGIR